MQKKLINLEPIKAEIREKLLEKYNTTLYMNTDVIDVRVDIKEMLEQYMKDHELKEPTVYITADAYIKLRKLVEDTTTEIGWYGIVSTFPGLEATYCIEDIIVYPQTVSGATCTQDDDKMFEFEMSLTTEQVNHKRFHGHSHVNMGVTPSGVDEQFYTDLLTQVEDYFIIMVTNKKGDTYIRFYDVEHNIVYSNVPLNVLLVGGIDLGKWYDKQKENLSNKSYLSSGLSNFKGSTLETSKKTYTAEDQAKRYEELWDDFEDENRVVWDDNLGMVTVKEQKYYYDHYPTYRTGKLSNKHKKGKR